MRGAIIFAHGVDGRRIAEVTLVFGKRPQIEEMAEDEQRVVIRVTPYATFVTPPRHVWKMSDINTLTHYTSTSMPW